MFGKLIKKLTGKLNGKLPGWLPGRSAGAKVPFSAAQLFHKNEVETNRLSAYAMLAFSAMILLFALISYQWMESFNLGGKWCINLVAADSVLFMITFMIAVFVDFDRPWLKDVILFSTLLFSAVIYFLYPMNSAFMLFGPLLLSTRYYDGKLTARISFATWLCYVVVMQLSVVLNSRVEAVAALRAYLEITIFNYPYDVWKYHIIPRSFVLLIMGVLGVLLSENGRKLIIGQAEKAQQAAALSAQMDLAAEIQTKALPPAAFVTEDKTCRLCCSMNPAKEVGGDFYDYFMLGADRLAILIADVSDKGLPAAMFMMAAKNTLRLFLETCPTVEEAFRKTNEALCKANRGEMFVTVWGGIIELSSGKTDFVNAGHAQPLIRQKMSGKAEWVTNDPDLFLGVFEDAELRHHSLNLAPGDCLILYTDGVTDAKNREGQRYGDEKLRQTVEGLPASAEALQAGIAADVEAFYRGMPQFDDITILICERSV